MVETSPEDRRNYQKEFTKLQKRSDYYRRKCAQRALRMSRANKLLELTSFALAAIIAGALTAALSGLIPASPVQKLAIALSVVIALLNAVVRPFFHPGEFVKLFYVAGEFLDIKERAGRAKLQCGTLGSHELRSEYNDLNLEYTGLKKAYIEYIRTPVYYRHKHRKLKVLGNKFTELPPMGGKSDKSK